MTVRTSSIPSEGVLDAFAVEPDHDKATLDKYLRLYPAHAMALIELSRELSRTDLNYDSALTPADETLLDAVWRRRVSTVTASAVNPLASLAPKERADLADLLGLKRQIFTLFREGRIALATVPSRFLRRMAAAVSLTVDELIAGLSVPMATARSYKSDGKPLVAPAQVTFERALIDAGVEEADRAALLAEGGDGRD